MLQHLDNPIDVFRGDYQLFNHFGTLIIEKTYKDYARTNDEFLEVLRKSDILDDVKAGMPKANVKDFNVVQMDRSCLDNRITKPGKPKAM